MYPESARSTAARMPPTPAPTTTMHVGDLDGSSTWTYRRWFWQASVTIAVHDDNHNPVTGATINGSWGSGYSGSAQCTTNSNGSCTVSTGNIWRSSSQATFTVNNVTRSLFTYAPAGNHDPDGDSNGTSIIVSRP